jgi:hypothetical protein
MSGDLLHRVELHEPEQARAALARSMLPWIGEQLKQGRELVLEARLLEDDITQKQRGYFHAVVLQELSDFVRPGGVKHAPEVWKVYLKERFLGFKVVTSIDPLTGKKRRLRHRVSTEDLGIRGYANFIDECIAFAATECGYTVSEPLPPELRPGRRRPTAKQLADQETGEILETTA